MLPAISLWQPWASAATFPHLKGHETRHWPAPARLIGQRFAIHAAKRAPPVNLSSHVQLRMEALFGTGWRKTVPRGCIVGTAVLASCLPTTTAQPSHMIDFAFGDWSEDRFAWALTEVTRLKDPIPWSGRQGWFSVEIPDIGAPA